MQTKSFLSTVVMGLLAVSLLSACSKSERHDPTTLVRGNQAEPPTLDIAKVQDSFDMNVLYDAYEGLVDFDQADQPVPGIAQSWEISKDGKVYTFHLRHDAKWSNGEPLTAKDFVYSWQRALDPKTASPYSFVVAKIKNGAAISAGKMPASSLGVKIIDPYTLQITLQQPTSYFLRTLYLPVMYPLYEPAVKQYGDAFIQPGRMVSDGAYMLKEWVPNGYILLTKNPYYYDAKDVKIDNVKFLPITDTSAEFQQYKSGGLDMTFAVPVDQYQQIQKDYPTQFHTVQYIGTYFYDFNMAKGVFKNNLPLRQALSMAIDRDTLVNEVVAENNQPIYSMLPHLVEQGTFDQFKPYSWQALSYPERVAIAQKLFTQAGYSAQHPLVFTLSYNTNDLHKKVAIAMVSMWQQAFGNAIQVKLNNEEWNVLLTDRTAGNYELVRDDWIADYDSVDEFNELAMCNNPENNARYCNPAYDKLIVAAEATTDPQLRIKLIEQAQTLAMNEYPIIPLFQFTYSRLVKPYVKGYDPTNNHLDMVHSKWIYFSDTN